MTRRRCRSPPSRWSWRSDAVAGVASARGGALGELAGRPLAFALGRLRAAAFLSAFFASWALRSASTLAFLPAVLALRGGRVPLRLELVVGGRLGGRILGGAARPCPPGRSRGPASRVDVSAAAGSAARACRGAGDREGAEEATGGTPARERTSWTRVRSGVSGGWVCERSGTWIQRVSGSAGCVSRKVRCATVDAVHARNSRVFDPVAEPGAVIS